jgi:hypothetical protein
LEAVNLAELHHNLTYRERCAMSDCSTFGYHREKTVIDAAESRAVSDARRSLQD